MVQHFTMTFYHVVAATIEIRINHNESTIDCHYSPFNYLAQKKKKTHHPLPLSNHSIPFSCDPPLKPVTANNDALDWPHLTSRMHGLGMDWAWAGQTMCHVTTNHPSKHLESCSHQTIQPTNQLTNQQQLLEL